MAQSTSIKTRIKDNIGNSGLKIDRKFTKEDEDIYKNMTFELRTSQIKNPDGSVVFEQKRVEVPDFWSQVAVDILAQKYFRKTGVPLKDEKGKTIKDEDGNTLTGSETSIKQVAKRMASTWRYWGEKYGYFEKKKDADAFEDEVQWMIANQMAVPNSPQWFNTGLAHTYGIKGNAQGHYYVDPETEEVKKSEDAYTRPQPHACFIQNVEDNLVGNQGIFDLMVKEARLFKYGSGTGTNFSKIRGKGESLSGGGVSSGLISFLKVIDSAAGSIRSGGTTRRAAKMVIVDIDHPEIEDYIHWKVKEEQKVASLVTGSYINKHYLTTIISSAKEDGIDPEKNPFLKKTIREAKKNFVPLNYIKKALMFVENGGKVEDFVYETYDTDFRSEAYATVSGQNSNNSIRIENDFLEAVKKDRPWDLVNRTDGKVNKTVSASALWEKIAQSAWASADPGIQFHTTINEWHTCPKDGEIRGSNPCSEYMFLDETACNLYQINVGKFYNDDTGEFDIDSYKHCIRLCTIILEISVLMSQLPSKEMAKGTYTYRTLGLGFANVGSMLMRMGVPYESPKGYALTGAISAILGGEAYTTSAEMAKVQGTFKRYKKNQDDMLRVIRNHRRAAYDSDESEYENLTVLPYGLDQNLTPKKLLKAAQLSWDMALSLGEEFGYRNAQVTCIAPTGTSGLVMDCDTTGLEPDFALVKFKKLVGGGYFKITNNAITPALKKLGYSKSEIQDIKEYATGVASLENSPHINTASLKSKGFTFKEINEIENLLPTTFHIKYVFNKWTLTEKFCTETLKISKATLSDPNLNILKFLGFSDTQIEEANRYLCGTMTIEGAPHIKQEHLPVFDCANKCGELGTRYISISGHLHQMAACQPFISGAISKTVNMPEESTKEDVKETYKKSWRLMIKANALYRDSSKLSQPLSTSHDTNSVYAKLFDFSEEDIQDVIDTEKIQKELIATTKRPMRKKLPDERHSITHKFSIAGHTAFMTVGLFPDGKPGELFVSMNKQGSTLAGIMDAWATSVSFSLQYGMPLDEVIRKIVYTRFEPSGMTSNPEIPRALSLLDYIGRWLALRFLPKAKAKLYHNPDLVDQSYSSGTNSKIFIPFINPEGHPEFRTDDLDTLIENEVTKGIQKASQDQEQKLNNIETSKRTTTEIHTEVYSPSSGETLEQDFKQIQQQISLRQNNEDSPLCAVCGSVTIRNGSCYKCTNCGETTGCS